MISSNKSIVCYGHTICCAVVVEVQAVQFSVVKKWRQHVTYINHFVSVGRRSCSQRFLLQIFHVFLFTFWDKTSKYFLALNVVDHLFIFTNWKWLGFVPLVILLLIITLVYTHMCIIFYTFRKHKLLFEEGLTWAKQVMYRYILVKTIDWIFILCIRTVF